MKVRLTAGRWDQVTRRGITIRRAGEAFSVADDVAEWLIRSGAAEAVGKTATAPDPETENVPPPAGGGDELDDILPEPDGSSDESSDAEADAEDDEEGADGAPDSEAPAKAAPKSEWEAYAVSRGVPAKDAAALSKQELIARTA